LYNLDEIKKIPITNFLSGQKRKITKGYIYELCPFCTHKWHFSVDIHKNLYNSYAQCVQAGDIIDFIRKKENLDFQSAIKMLGENYNVEKKTFKPLQKKELDMIQIHENLEAERIRKIKNDFFRFLKRMQFDKTMFKCIKMDGDRLLHYIYNLEGIGVYKI
jgi:DNA primase